MTDKKKYLILLPALLLASCISPASRKIRKAEVSPANVLVPVWEKTLIKKVRFSDMPQQFATPLLYKNKIIYAGDSSGRFYAISLKGSTLWKTRLTSAIQSTPLVIPSKKMVVVGTIGGKLFGINIKNGKILWSFQGFGSFLGVPVYKEGVIYASTSKNMLYAVTAKNGLLHWSKRHETFIGFSVKGHSSPVLDENVLYLGLSDGKIIALDIENRGKVLWSKKLDISGKENYIDADGTPVIIGNTIIASSYQSGISALNKNNGDLLWRFPVYGVKTFSVKNNKIYFVSATKGIFCISAEGRLLWNQSVNMGSSGQPLIAGSRLLIPFDDGGIIALNADNGYFYQRFATGSGISGGLSYYNKKLSVISNNGKLYLFDIK